MRDRHCRYTIAVEESDNAVDLSICADSWIRVDDTVVTEPESLADKGPALGEFQVALQELAPALSAGPEESRIVQHWGAVLVDGAGVASIVLGKDTVRRRAHPDLTDVAVILSGTDLDGVNIAFAMVETLINTHRKGEFNDWLAGCSWAREQYYVYLHRESDGVFYIEKGSKTGLLITSKNEFDAWEGGSGHLPRQETTPFDAAGST